jgi:hypothetical protein
MVLGGLSFLLVKKDTIPALLMGRKSGNVKSGTVLTEKPATSKPVTPEPTNALKLNFEIIGGWKYNDGKNPIPQSVRNLEGKQVEVTGFMMPINETKAITRFILIQSLWGCCFGQTPDVNHIIVVNMETGKSIDFYPDPVKVLGKFQIGETREEGYLISIYQLEANKVVVK